MARTIPAHRSRIVDLVPTHDASIVGFGFTDLLNFRLLPPLKNVGKARRYRPSPGEGAAWPKLDPVLSTKTIE